MILITGATGNNGAELTKRLAGSTARVRAMVRKHPEAADALPGTEYVIADFDDPVSIRQALEGAQRAFLTTNSTERVEVQQLNFVEEARAAGVRHIVYLSQLHAARVRRCVSCAITPLCRTPLPHREWHLLICVPISTCRASSDSARRLRRRDAFLRRRAMLP